MPSEKKLVAAAAHTRQQANLYAAGVESAEEKVVRAEEHLESAQAALAKMRELAAEKEAAAVKAESAASGIPAYVNAGVASMGVSR